MTITVPADMDDARAEHILDQVDDIGLTESIKKHTDARLSRNGIPETSVYVES